MNQQQRNVLLGIGIAVAVLVIIILIFILRSSAPKINQIHSIGSQYQLVPTNDGLTFIDNNSNLQQYTDSNKSIRFIGSTNMDFQPKISLSANYVSTITGPQNSSFQITPIANYGGNAGFGTTTLAYGYLSWGIDNLITGIIPTNSRPDRSQPADIQTYYGKLAQRSADNINQVLKQSPQDWQFQNIVYSDNQRIMLAVTEPGNVKIKSISTANWQETSNWQYNSLVESYQAGQKLILRAESTTPVEIIDTDSKRYVTNLQLPARLVYPVGSHQLCVLIQNSDNVELGLYDYKSNRYDKKFKLPSFIFQPNNIVANTKNIYISTNSGMFEVQNFLGGVK